MVPVLFSFAGALVYIVLLVATSFAFLGSLVVCAQILREQWKTGNAINIGISSLAAIGLIYSTATALEGLFLGAPAFQ